MGSDKSLAMQMDLVDVDIRICWEKKMICEINVPVSHTTIR